MADKIIAAKLQVDTGSANASIKETNKGLNDFKTKANEAGNAAKSTGKEVEGTGGAFGNLKGKLSSLPGPLGQAGEGVGKLSMAFKALLLNPVVLVITLIVGALALLFKAFTSTNDGADKLEQIMSGVGTTIDVIRDRILKVAGAIAKFFSGDFKGALADGRAAVSGIGEEISREFQAAANATRILQELGDELRDLGVSRAKLNRDLAQTKELISDENATLGQRKKAIAQVRDAEAAQSKQELENARKSLEALKAKNALSDKSDEKLQEEADAQAKIYQLEEQSARDIRSLNKQERSIERGEQAKAEAAYKEHLAKRNAALAESKAKQKEIDDAGNRAIADAEKVLEKELDREGQFKLLIKQYDERKEAARKAGFAVLKITQAFQQERAALELKFAEEDAAKLKAIEEDKQKFFAELAARKQTEISAALEKEKTAKAEADALDAATAQNRIGRIEEVKNRLIGLADVVGKQTIAGKALGIATALINTYQGASEVIKQKSTLPSPFDIISKIAGVATIIATGIKTVKAITAVQVPGGGGGGSVSAPNISQAAPLSPTTGTTALDQASLNRLGNSTVRAFVVDRDIENNRSRNERLNRAARLG